MRACIIGIQNIKHMTLISLYTQYFEKNKIAYDLIYIDKYGIEECTTASNVYKFDATNAKYNGVIGKIKKTIDFRKYAIEILNANDYDFLAVWREQTACIFANYLKKRYFRKYSVNIRDLYNKRFLPLTIGLKIAVNHSAFNTISSEGFLPYIPNADYLMVHSANKELLSNGLFNIGSQKKRPIRITYIGTLRFPEYCKFVVDCFQNDDRFELAFIGQGSEKIFKYVEEKKIDNVICIEKFEPQDTIRLLDGTNLINCAFGTNELAEKMLTPIRLYYAIYGGIPVLTTTGTWVSDLAKSMEMNISIAFSDMDISSIANEVYFAYTHMDFTTMNGKQKVYIQKIDDAFSCFQDKLDEYFCKVNK